MKAYECRQSPSEYCQLPSRLVWKKTRRAWLATRRWKMFESMFSRLNRIPACDRRTDGRTDILRQSAPTPSISIAPFARHLLTCVRTWNWETADDPINFRRWPSFVFGLFMFREGKVNVVRCWWRVFADNASAGVSTIFDQYKNYRQ